MRPLRLAEVMSQDAAEKLFTPHVDDLWKVIEAGWTGWMELGSEAQATLCPRTRASIVYDYMAKDARKRFGNRERERIWLLDCGFLVIRFGREALLRFKKFDQDYRPSNIQTRQQFQYFWQLQIPDLPPEPTKLSIGYRLNPSQTEITDVSITCWQSPTRRAWILPIGPGGISGYSPIELLPEAPQAPEVRPKRTRKAKEA